MQAYLNLIVSALNWFPGVKTKVAAIAAVVSALIVAVSAVLDAFGAGFTIPYLNEINAFLIALTAVGAANQPNNLPKP
jgi:uncharacterized membrane protein